MSCDTEPTDVDGPHHQGDVIPLLSKNWDLVIGFPPCTHLARSGARWWPDRLSEQEKAIRFAQALYGARSPSVAIENPIGKLSTAWRKPDQIVHPWWFGDNYTKATCLWLRGLPNLVQTHFPWEPPDSTYIHYASGKDRARKRSVTPQGLAHAMADQWG